MIPEEAIRLRSYLIWQSEGCPDGQALEHWLRAKAELEAESRPSLQQVHEFERYVIARPRLMRAPQRFTSARVLKDDQRALRTGAVSAAR